MLRNTYRLAATVPVATTLVLVGASQLVTALNTSDSQNLLPLPEASDVPKETEQRIIQAYGKLPLHFEPNQGQIAEEAKFMARGNGYTLFLTSKMLCITGSRELWSMTS